MTNEGLFDEDKCQIIDHHSKCVPQDFCLSNVVNVAVQTDQ